MPVGSRTQQVQHVVAGGTGSNTVTNYNVGVTTPTAHAHAVASTGSPARSHHDDPGPAGRGTRANQFHRRRARNPVLQPQRRGHEPAPWQRQPAWPDYHGYLDKPSDSATGLTDLGAREYDPTLGRFLSADPVLDAENPLQDNGYSYAWNNPNTHTDPTGLRPVDDGGPITGSDLKSWQDTENRSQAAKPGPSGGSGGSGCANRGCGNDSYGGTQPSTSQPDRSGHGGYRYTYNERIGPISRTGSPEAALPKLMANARAVFPFPISGCDAVAAGAHCKLHPGPHWLSFVHGNGWVDVTADSTSFTFTMVSDNYFDRHDSTITFRLSDRSGDLYLSQIAVGKSRNRVIQTVAPTGAWMDWQIQADGVRTVLDPPPVSFLVNIDHGRACSFMGVIC